MQDQILQAKALLQAMGIDESFANDQTLPLLAQSYGWTPSVTTSVNVPQLNEEGVQEMDGEGNLLFLSETQEVPNPVSILEYIKAGTANDWKKRITQQLATNEAKAAKVRSVQKASELFNH